jgi:hypothetical protein
METENGAIGEGQVGCLVASQLVEERGTQRAGAAPFKLAMAMGGVDRRASNRTWRNRGAVAHDGRAELCGGHEAASRGVLRVKRGGREGGLGRGGRWHLEADVAMMQGI